MSARLCPACIHRRGRVIAADCPVCSGQGVLVLGHAAKVSGDVEASYAVAIVLEAAARDLEKRTARDAQKREQETRQTLASVLQALRRAGVLEGSASRTASGTATDIAQNVSLVPIRPLDWTLIDAQSYAYGYTDRPLSRGMPVLSADGHPSHLARVCDPADPLTPTGADAQTRAQQRRSGAVLAAAAAEQKRKGRR